MDYLERLFHIAPDGGNGLFEVAISMALLLVPIALLAARRKSKLDPRAGTAAGRSD
jgi:hypothetical protein